MDTLKIIGIATVTTNQNGQAATDLGQLWGRFGTEHIMEKIPGKLGTEVYSVYTDYESNYQGHYTTIIGARVASLEEIPDGMTGREFEPIKFKKFTAKGEMPGAVVATWQEIWSKDAELNRAYLYDYEVYGDRCQLGDQSEVDIFVGVR